MAIFRGTTIRGSQITDYTVDRTKILGGTLTDVEIASNAAISENKLNINWHSHKEALEDRKIVDFVQVNGIDVIGTEVDLEAAVPSLVGVASADSLGNVEGIIIDGPKNLCPMRDAISGEPLVAEISGVEYEVLARMEQDAGKYVLKFYTTSGANGAEVPYAVPATKVDFQYARRFNLSTVDEMFAANEKFVHGAADITAALDLQQLANDLYGASGKLDRDGHANLAKSLVEQLADEVNRAQTAETGILNALSAETTNRTNADQHLQDEIDTLNGDATVLNSVDYKIKTEVLDVLGSTQAGKGAATVKISPIAGVSADNVQGALEYLKANAGDALTTFKGDLGSTDAGKGASLVAVEAGKFGALTNVEAVLENHDARIVELEDGKYDKTGGLISGDVEIQGKLYVHQSDLIKLHATKEDGNGVATDYFPVEIVGKDVSIGGTGKVDVSCGDNITLTSGNNITLSGAKQINLGCSNGIILSTGGNVGISGMETTVSGSSHLKLMSGSGVDITGGSGEANISGSGINFDAQGNLFKVEAGGIDLDGEGSLVKVQTSDKIELNAIGGVDVVAPVVNAANSEVKAQKVTLTNVTPVADAEATSKKYVDDQFEEVVIARGTESTLNDRLSVSIRPDGYLVEDAKIHVHRKYTITLSANQSQVLLPVGEKFNISSGAVAQNSAQVYVNGILQSNGINFSEIKDAVDLTKGIGVDFSPEELVAGDVVVIEWVVNNAN